jgi:hypothetical protein
MSLVELLVILLISLGIFDKSKIIQYYQKIINFQKGQKRQIIGDTSINENWIWVDKDEEE